MNAAPPYVEQVERDGFAVFGGAVTDANALALIPALAQVELVSRYGRCASE